MKSLKKNLLFVAAFIVLYLIFTRTVGSYVPKFDLTEESISVTSPEEFSFSVSYDDITEIELAENFSRGKCLDGRTNRGFAFGTWENEDCGTYSLVSYTACRSAVIVKTGSGESYVFNLESEPSTREFHRAMLEYLDELGYKIQ